MMSDGVWKQFSAGLVVIARSFVLRYVKSAPVIEPSGEGDGDGSPHR